MDTLYKMVADKVAEVEYLKVQTSVSQLRERISLLRRRNIYYHLWRVENLVTKLLLLTEERGGLEEG